MGLHGHPEITMHVLNFADHVACVSAMDWDALGRMLMVSTEKLRISGADFAVCPDNTAHLAYDRVATKLALPWVHIAEPVIAEAQRQNYKRVAILGTRALVDSNVYWQRLSDAGIVPVRPDSADRDALNALIFDELARGIVSVKGRSLFMQLCERMRVRENCDAVILGCTELPMLVDAADKPVLPTLDSARLLAEAAVVRAVS